MQTRPDPRAGLSPAPTDEAGAGDTERRDHPLPALGARIVGVGSFLPDRVLTNYDLAAMVETSHEWIVSRTGIRQRHIAAEGETTADLAEAAARAALHNAGVGAEEIDLIILATATPDNTFPSTAVQVQHRLGITGGAAFDVAAVCSGFVYALTTADAMLKSGHARRALVIGAETFSRILDWSDRTTCVLFGDGAGAVVVEYGASDSADSAGPASLSAGARGILASSLRSDGAHSHKLFVDGGPSSTGTVGRLRMRGQDVFRFAISATVDVVNDVMMQANVTADDLDWFVPHQANRRIIDASAKKLGIAPEKVVLTVERHGNTSAASIPLALDDAARKGLFSKGDLVLLEAMGGGFTWGAVLLRW